MKKVLVRQFPEGAQGLVVDMGYATNKVHMIRTWDMGKGMCSTYPLEKHKVHYIRSGGKKWPLTWCVNEARFEVAVSNAYTVTFNGGKVTIKRKG